MLKKSRRSSDGALTIRGGLTDLMSWRLPHHGGLGGRAHPRTGPMATSARSTMRPRRSCGQAATDVLDPMRLHERERISLSIRNRPAAGCDRLRASALDRHCTARVPHVVQQNWLAFFMKRLEVFGFFCLAHRSSSLPFAAVCETRAPGRRCASLAIGRLLEEAEYRGASGFSRPIHHGRVGKYAV